MVRLPVVAGRAGSHHKIKLLLTPAPIPELDPGAKVTPENEKVRHHLCIVQSR